MFNKLLSRMENERSTRDEGDGTTRSTVKNKSDKRLEKINHPGKSAISREHIPCTNAYPGVSLERAGRPRLTYELCRCSVLRGKRQRVETTSGVATVSFLLRTSLQAVNVHREHSLYGDHDVSYTYIAADVMYAARVRCP
jgi:hypothetical protein